MGLRTRTPRTSPHFIGRNHFHVWPNHCKSLRGWERRLAIKFLQVWQFWRILASSSNMRDWLFALTKGTNRSIFSRLWKNKFQQCLPFLSTLNKEKKNSPNSTWLSDVVTWIAVLEKTLGHRKTRRRLKTLVLKLIGRHKKPTGNVTDLVYHHHVLASYIHSCRSCVTMFDALSYTT